MVFFAVFGYDAMSTAAEESTEARRVLPKAIMLSLAISMVLYVLACLVLTGMVKYTELNTAAPMADALKAVGYDWIASLVSLGALAGLTTVILILMLGQSRVLFAMSRDGCSPAGCPPSTPATARPG